MLTIEECACLEKLEILRSGVLDGGLYGGVASELKGDV
jgi:hypothetical protein